MKTTICIACSAHIVAIEQDEKRLCEHCSYAAVCHAALYPGAFRRSVSGGDLRSDLCEHCGELGWHAFPRASLAFCNEACAVMYEDGYWERYADNYDTDDTGASD